MQWFRPIWWLVFLVTLIWVGPLWAAPIPPLAGRVNDLAGLLEPAVRQRLEQRLEAHDTATGVEIVLLTIASLEGESIEGYSMRVVESWKLGKKGQDNGVLLLVAKAERKLRIEVGYGIEGNIPDAVASRIVNEVITPRFASGDFAGGLAAGIEALVVKTGGTPDASVSPPSRARPEAPPPGPLGLVLSVIGMLGKAVFFGFFVIVMVVFSVLGRLGGRSGRSRIVSRRSSVDPWSGGFGGGTLGGGGFGGGGGSFGGGGASGSW